MGALVGVQVGRLVGSLAGRLLGSVVGWLLVGGLVSGQAGWLAARVFPVAMFTQGARFLFPGC